MAAIPLSGLEAAAIALLALLAAVAVDSAIRGAPHRPASGSDRLRDKTKSTARAIPIPDQSRDRCPADRGRLVTRRWHMSEISRDYQARVTGFPPTTEWQFENIEFDGFRSPECHLQEAKARYNQFFDKYTGLPKRFFELFGATRMLSQARAQSMVIRKSPPTKLTWYFMQPISHRYFAGEFAAENLPIESLLQP
jgi:hypothetical protein